MARVYNKAKDLDQAIESQSKAVVVLSSLEKYADSDYLANIILTLSEF